MASDSSRIREIEKLCKVILEEVLTIRANNARVEQEQRRPRFGETRENVPLDPR